MGGYLKILPKPDFGTAVTYVFSPTRTVLVKNEFFEIKLWKPPGGHIKSTDTSIRAGAMREVSEETGILLYEDEITYIQEEQVDEKGTYFPHFFIASISEEKIETLRRLSREDNGSILRAALFNRSEVPTMLDLVERHRAFIQKIEEYKRIEGSW